jgi:hypothetical protein
LLFTYCFFYQFSLLCNPPCPFTFQHPLALALFPCFHCPCAEVLLINTATFVVNSPETHPWFHVTFRHVNSQKLHFTCMWPTDYPDSLEKVTDSSSTTCSMASIKQIKFFVWQNGYIASETSPPSPEPR